MTPAIKVLQQRGIDFKTRHYKVSVDKRHFGEHAAEALGQDPARVFKTLLSIIDGNPRQPVVALVAVSRQLDLKKVASECHGRKAALADASHAQRITGYVVGGISPLGQKQQLTTLVDESASTFESIFVSAGKRGLQLELAPDTLVKLLEARYCQLSK